MTDEPSRNTPLPGPVLPEPDRFVELAGRHTVVPVWTELVADLVTPVSVFARLCGDEPGFLLESVEHGDRWARWSFVGRRPQARMVVRGRSVTWSGTLPPPPGLPTDEGSLAAAEHLLATFRSPTSDELTADSGVVTAFPPLSSGLVGWFGYDVVREIERLEEPPPDDQGHPDAVLEVIGEVAALDHWSQTVTLIVNVVVPEGADRAAIEGLYGEAVSRLEQLATDGARPIDEPFMAPPRPDDPLPAVTTSFTEQEWTAAVHTAKEHILAGDIFQVVLAQRFELEGGLGADPFDLYRVLRQVNPSPYMYFVKQPELTLVGCSPEPMVQLLDGKVISRPIAGTRFRGRTEEHDRTLAAELLEHPKERAEHVMLVDLARNDVGRIVEFGTETVDEMMTLERYSHVMHLTSQVSGRLRGECTPVDVLRATLPAGTVSGAPKVRAMEIIDALEPTRRGPYAGTVGYLDFTGNIDTAIAIRTMVVGDGRATVTAGAGIVVDSDPADERLETQNKARALLAAVAAARRMGAARAVASVDAGLDAGPDAGVSEGAGDRPSGSGR